MLTTVEFDHMPLLSPLVYAWKGFRFHRSVVTEILLPAHAVPKPLDANKAGRVAGRSTDTEDDEVDKRRPLLAVAELSKVMFRAAGLSTETTWYTRHVDRGD
jgi:hypothetical protein